jgi:hypothetical protein
MTPSTIRALPPSNAGVSASPSKVMAPIVVSSGKDEALGRARAAARLQRIAAHHRAERRAQEQAESAWVGLGDAVDEPDGPGVARASAHNKQRKTLDRHSARLATRHIATKVSARGVQPRVAQHQRGAFHAGSV